MAILLRDQFSYPGLLDILMAEYTCQHGVSPGQIHVLTKINPTQAAASGTFTLGDGERTLTLKDCKLDRIVENHSETAVTWSVTLLDRRWRWQYGEISGEYNRIDSRGNLVKEYVRTPREIAELCLAAMGETDYEIDLPDGVSREDLVEYSDNPPPGEITPPTNTNPYVTWTVVNPAQALASFVAEFGRRLVWCPVRDKVIIARPGDGALLPINAYLNHFSQSMQAMERPKGIGVIGAPVRFQGRFKLVPVGREWDGRWVDIDQLSYRPNRKPQVGIYQITLTGGAGSYSITGTVNGVDVSGSGTTAGDAFDSLIGSMSGNTSLSDRIDVTNDGTITGKKIGDEISIDLDFSGPEGSQFKLKTEQVPYRSCWDSEPAGSFGGVRATDRLTYSQAQALAIDSVWRYYRLANESVETGWDYDREPTEILVPGYGTVPNRRHLVLEPTQVEQIVPLPPNPDILNNSLESDPAEVELYDGYSRDRQAAAYGSTCNLCAGRWRYKDAHQNTAADARVPIDPSVDTANWMIEFPQAIYRTARIPSYPGKAMSSATHADLVVETAVQVRDPATLAPVRYRQWIEYEPRPFEPPQTPDTVTLDLSSYQIPSPQPIEVTLPPRKYSDGAPDQDQWPEGIEWHPHEDIQRGIVGVYTLEKGKWKFVASSPTITDVSYERADYYLLGHILEHQITGGATATYKGIQLIPLDGAVMQVTYSVGNSSSTTASRNHEHGVFTLPYPKRRLAENLAADPLMAAAKLRTQPSSNRP